MPRLHLTEDPTAFAHFKSLCAERRNQDALRLVVFGGHHRPAVFGNRYTFPAQAEIPTDGAFYLLPSDLDGDPVFTPFMNWIRTRNPQPEPLPHFDALRAQFGLFGEVERSWV